VLHHAHARAAKIEQLFLSAFESSERERSRTSVEIDCASHIPPERLRAFCRRGLLAALTA
jgi:hypothetical protein